MTRRRPLIRLALLLVASSSVLVPAALRAAEEREMIVEDGNDISIEYTLSTKDDGVVNSNVDGDPFTYTQGLYNLECMTGLQKHLAGLKAGDELSLVLPPEEGCGPVDPTAIIEIESELIPEKARKVGQIVQTRGPHGTTLRAKVKAIKDEMIVLDLNHPLAGKTLYFDVKILNIEKGHPPAYKPPPPPPALHRQ